MQRTLTFGTESIDRNRYHLLVNTARIAGAREELTKLQREQKTQTRQDRKSETRLKSAFWAIGTPVGDHEPKDGLDLDLRSRTLVTAGGTVVLEQEDFARLVRYVEATPWLPELAEYVADLEDWLEAAPRD